jgi:Xaa-Pro aminopeptidase
MASALAPPFDVDRLDEGLSAAGVDLLLVVSKHNRQYLTGGYRSFFFDVEDAMGLTRYHSMLGYPTGRPELAFYLGNPLERWTLASEPVWIGDLDLDCWNGPNLIEPTVQRVRALGLERGTIGIETPFVPADTYIALRERLPEATFVDASAVLEDLRAVKTESELEAIREVSWRVVDSMVATFHRCHAGITTEEIEQIMREEEAAHGVHFQYCLVTTGLDSARAPSTTTRWETGMSLGLDSGGTYGGYIGDFSRMGVLGPPTALQKELLAEVNAIQLAARMAVRAGAFGHEVYSAAERLIERSRHRRLIDFIAHGMGLVVHEAPYFAPTSPLRPPDHADRPLVAGMVLSIETGITHPEVGYVKLEDTIIVTAEGHEAVGDAARGWTVVDPALRPDRPWV